MDFCYQPGLAVEATLQPIRRFGFDAAIMFSDILVVPDAMGHTVRFDTGEGPRMAAIENPKAWTRSANRTVAAEPVFERPARARALPRRPR